MGEPPVRRKRRRSKAAFTLEDLAWFRTPRKWAEIVPRYGKYVSRRLILLADDEGGAGYLRWIRERRAWTLTDRGRRLCAHIVLDNN